MDSPLAVEKVKRKCILRTAKGTKFRRLRHIHEFHTAEETAISRSGQRGYTSNRKENTNMRQEN